MSTPAEVATSGSRPEPMDQPMFSTVLREHASWVLSEGKEGRRANLKDVDLRYIDFTEAHLARASLRGADLRGCDLTGAQLQEADFTEAKLSSANLTGVNLERSNFASANLERAILDGANVAYSNFQDANLSEASLRNTLMEKATLRLAIANRTLFEATDMTDVNAREASFQNARFHRTQMARADFRDAKCDGAEFVGAQFSQTQFKGASFGEVGFGQSDFTEALDVSQQYKNAAIHEQKARIDEHLAKIESDRQALAQRETEFRQRMESHENDKKSWIELHDTEKSYSGQLAKIARQLKIMALVWFLLLLAFLGVTALTAMSLPIDQLNYGEIGIMVAVPLIVCILAFVTAAKAKSASRRVGDQVALRERKLFSGKMGENAPQPVLSNPSEATIQSAPISGPSLEGIPPVEAPKRKLGFGKSS